MASTSVQPPSVSSWKNRAFAPIDGASSAFFRIGFGLMMAWDLLYYALDGRLERFYLNPVILFKYPGFSWVEPAPDNAMRALIWVLIAAALAVAAGWLYRLAASVLFFGLTYLYLLCTTTYNNHNYLFCLVAFLLIVLPLHRTASVDARRTEASHTVPVWVVWLLRFQTGVPYFFGGLAKLNTDWIIHAQPMRMWFETGNMGGRLKLAIFQETWMAYAFSWGGVLFDLLIVPALLWRKTRVLAFTAALLFHWTNANLFHIGIFPWTMILISTIYFAPDWPRRLGLMRKLNTLKDSRGAKKRAQKRNGPKPQQATPERPFNRRFVLLLLGVWIVVQCLLPFRHWLVQGHVDWTDEHHRYSWRMKLRDKQGEIQFLMVDPTSRQSTVLEGAEELLTLRQRRYLTQDPEIIRQFAHFLAAQLAGKGHHGVEIHALTRISMNNRPPQALLDPETNLAAAAPSLSHQPWILPLEARSKR